MKHGSLKFGYVRMGSLNEQERFGLNPPQSDRVKVNQTKSNQRQPQDQDYEQDYDYEKAGLQTAVGLHPIAQAQSFP